MNARKSLHRLLQLALIEIRHESKSGGDLAQIGALSDLFHNLPLALVQESADFDRLIADLRERASVNAGLLAWVESNLLTE